MVFLILLPVIFVVAGKASAIAFVSGALCAIVPQAYFAISLSRASRRGAQRAARAGLAAEGGKFLLSATMFALVFAVIKPVFPGLVFLGFGVFWLLQLAEGIRLLTQS